MEFSIGDWQYGEMFLLDRRKTNEVLSISVPDLTAREVRLMTGLLYQGSVSLSGTEDAKALRDVWKMFRVDSVRLDSLDVISEVDLLKTSSKSVKNSSAQNHFIKLQNIKKEIVEENEEYLSFRTGLEVECELCRETFQQEDDLMRHVDYIHQINNSMNDRIKFKSTVSLLRASSIFISFMLSESIPRGSNVRLMGLRLRIFFSLLLL
mgnify:CR=1 FL=1